MYHSRSIQDLCCITKATLFTACLTEADLQSLRVWQDRQSPLGFSPAVWCRAILHKTCHRDPAMARRVTDLLDLQYLDTVLLVRYMQADELEEWVGLWLAKPDGTTLPGLLWALCTDNREEIHKLGSRLCHEAITVSMRALIDGSDLGNRI